MSWQAVARLLRGPYLWSYNIAGHPDGSTHLMFRLLCFLLSSLINNETKVHRGKVALESYVSGDPHHPRPEVNDVDNRMRDCVTMPSLLSR